MKTEKHTPTPWTCNENLDLVFDANGNIVCENFFYHNRKDEIREKKPEQIDNMYRVIRAVNSHDALVETLDHIKLDLDHPEEFADEDARLACIYSRVCAALKLAKGEE